MSLQVFLLLVKKMKHDKSKVNKTKTEKEW